MLISEVWVFCLYILLLLKSSCDVETTQQSSYISTIASSDWLDDQDPAQETRPDHTLGILSEHLIYGFVYQL